MLSKKYYEMIADVLAPYAGEKYYVSQVIHDLIRDFEDDNPNFDRLKFEDRIYKNMDYPFSTLQINRERTNFENSRKDKTNE